MNVEKDEDNAIQFRPPFQQSVVLHVKGSYASTVKSTGGFERAVKRADEIKKTLKKKQPRKKK